MAKISIVVPIYKVEKYLEHCIDSIFNQSFDDFELILVDDGSPERSGMICDEIALRADDSILTNTIVIHQKNGGLSAARNSGIEWALKCSNSEWIVFIDSDDYLHKQFLEHLIESVIESNSDLAICDFVCVDSQGNDIDSEHTFLKGVVTDKAQMFKMSFANWRMNVAWNKLYKKNIFNDLRFDYGKIHEDIYIILSVLFRCERISFVDLPLYYYLSRADSITGEESDVARLDTLEADIRRYWFCKENNLPIDPWAVNHERRIKVAKLKYDVKPENKERYRELEREYKKVFLDYNIGVKNRLFYILCERYERLSGFLKRKA